MGNCVFRGGGELNRSPETIKVTTANGGVMELYPPITAECITSEFPNHAIFTDTDKHVLHTDELLLGKSYFLLPINQPRTAVLKPLETQTSKTQCTTPYRVSLDSHNQQRGHQKRWSADGAGLELSSTSTSTPRWNKSGVWKVKLMISPEQLSEILAKEATTEELVESLRTVAKCGNGIGAGPGSIAGSDHWTISNGPN